jgi:gamma-glutamyltranspeptidase
MLVQAIREAKTEDLYGRLEAGQLLRLEALSDSLQQIADIPEKGKTKLLGRTLVTSPPTELYSRITKDNRPSYGPAVKLTFNEYDIYVPDEPSTGPAFLQNLRHLQTFNFTPSDTTLTEYVYRVAEVTQNLYDTLNLTSRFHEGTSTNVAAMDLDDTYASLTT